MNWQTGGPGRAGQGFAAAMEVGLRTAAQAQLNVSREWAIVIVG